MHSGDIKIELWASEDVTEPPLSSLLPFSSPSLVEALQPTLVARLLPVYARWQPMDIFSCFLFQQPHDQTQLTIIKVSLSILCQSASSERSSITHNRLCNTFPCHFHSLFFATDQNRIKQAASRSSSCHAIFSAAMRRPPPPPRLLTLYCEVPRPNLNFLLRLSTTICSNDHSCIWLRIDDILFRPSFLHRHFWVKTSFGRGKGKCKLIFIKLVRI